MSFRDLDLKMEYRSRRDSVVNDFYIPALNESVLYKRAVGFFSSTSLVELASGICGLVENGGRIELIASPRLSEEDIQAINDGVRRQDEVIEEALLRELKNVTGRYEEERLNLLSNLIAAGRLEIKIAFLADNNRVGMFHEKMGLMYDKEGNIIAFTGSMNESLNAFMVNYESIDIYTSWSNDYERVINKEDAFSAMWKDYEPSIRVMAFPNIDRELINRYKVTNDIETNFDFQYDSILVETYAAKDTENHKAEVNNGPHIPEDVHIREYQSDAIKAWENRNYRGIFDMATGTGKTYTALAAISTLYEKKNHNLAVIIICPYQHLVEQWKEDIVKFGMKPIVAYSSSTQKDWRERLKTQVRSFNLGVIDHFSMVTTNASFSLDYVQEEMKKLKGNVLLVVDEAHNFGAEHLNTSLIPNALYRLALSATIDRYGDPEGTKKLYDYFGEKCIEYSLKDAIDNKMLTPYYYHPVVVSLNNSELDQYTELTEKIRKSIKKEESGKVVLSEYAKQLLIKRARLVAGASEKIIKLRELMQNYKNDNQILVYCGATTLHDIDYKEDAPPVDEEKQINVVADMLGNELGMRVSKFTSEEDAAERESIKSDFAEGKMLQALIAIRCLDEGVNIPSIRTAFILASSTNPKEYIQRRGRVLRTFPGKRHADIYDFITLPVPLVSSTNYYSGELDSVKGLAKREITRMKDFASIAENPFDSDALISEIQRIYDIDSLDEEENEYD